MPPDRSREIPVGSEMKRHAYAKRRDANAREHPRETVELTLKSRAREPAKSRDVIRFAFRDAEFRSRRCRAMFAECA